MDGRTDGQMDGRTDRQTDGPTDGPTKRVVESRSTRLKMSDIRALNCPLAAIKLEFIC